MLKHLFKLMWNKRKQNFLLLSEVFVSFMVIFTLFSLLVYYYQNYKKPLGFEYERVWSVNFDNRQLSKDSDSLTLYLQGLEKSLYAMPQIKEVSYTSSNFPFSTSMMSTALNLDARHIPNVHEFFVGDHYKDVLEMKLLEGRWFGPQDKVFKNKPIVINEMLKDEIFGKKPAIGKLIGDYENKSKFKVIGVVQDMKVDGDFSRLSKGMYRQIDTGYFKYTGSILLKVSPGADANFEGKLYKFLASTFKNAGVEITYLKDMRDAKNEITVIPMIIFIIVAGFLIINVALGLFGVLWYNISRRRGEIGLRRAIGAAGASVSRQLLTESMILASLSMFVGCFFAVQFPLLNVFDLPANVYFSAIILAIIFIYMLVTACSIYPGKQAAAILPATALHEE